MERELICKGKKVDLGKSEQSIKKGTGYNVISCSEKMAQCNVR